MKEIENISVAFDVLPNGKSVPIGRQFVSCNMVFNVKMEDFRQKVGLVAGGHMTKVLATITYASIKIDSWNSLDDCYLQ